MRHALPVLLLSALALAVTGLFDSTSEPARRPRPTASAAEAIDPFRVPSIHPPASAKPAPGLPEADWLAAAERELAAREYWASETPRGLQAPNRAHGLRAYFGSEGVRIVERTVAAPELVRMHLNAFGRGEQLATAVPARVTHANARVELAHDDVLEWYENAPRGLEQGFTVHSKPAGEGPLVLELAIEGAKVAPSGDGVVLACMGASTRRLGYGELAAQDANGRSLPAHLEPSERGLRIVTDDRDAAYPVTIDPMITGQADTHLHFGQASMQMGLRVAGAGDVNGDGYGDVLVGAQFYDGGQTDEGAAFLYLGGANGIASGVLPSAVFQSNSTGAFMGRGIASADVNGDGYSDLLIGCYGYPAGGSNVGAIFIFHGGPSGIPGGSPASASKTILSSTNSGLFGLEVQCAGDVNGDGYQDVIVGDSSHQGVGAAFLFYGSATGVTSSTSATASATIVSTQGTSRFGGAVGCAGDVNADGYDDIIVGADGYDSGETNEGAAFLFQGGPSGITSTNQTTANAMLQLNVAGLDFGRSVAGAGDVNGDGYADVMVGTQNYASSGYTAEGAVWLFLGRAGGIVNNQSYEDRFESFQNSTGLGGWGTIAGIGDVNGDGYADVALGLPSFDYNFTDEGSLVVVLGSAFGFSSTSPAGSFLFTVSHQASANMGVSVAAAGDVNGDGYADVLVGAYRYDVTATDEGSAFIYLGGPRSMISGDQNSSRYSLQSNQAGAMLGYSVAGAGDVNGDALGDVIVGAPGYDLGQVDEGAAFVFLGPVVFAAGAPGAAWATLHGNAAGADFGINVAGAGDVNGDGYADVIVGADAIHGTGGAYLFHGSARGTLSGTPETADASLGCDQSARFGSSVAGAGDVNGDGYSDVIVGAPNYTGPGAGGQAGSAFVYLGSSSGVRSGSVNTAAAELDAGLTGASFGHAVAGAGDVNGDGYSDVIVGAPFYTDGQLNEGAAFVFHGSASGVHSALATSAATELQSDDADANMGCSVAGAGDMNGDGFADVVVGAEGYGPTEAGRAWAWFGGASGIADGEPGTANMTFNFNNLANGLYGHSVAGVGDVNGDGFADVLVGGTGLSSGMGRVQLYLGTANPAPGDAPTNSGEYSNQANAFMGWSVAGAGDVDGDGFADIVIGAQGWDSGETDEGGAFYWNGGGGLYGRAQGVGQLRTVPSSQPVQSGGSSHDDSEFRISQHLVAIEGRERLASEVEHCPNGVPFGSGSCVHYVSPWLDAATATATGGPGLTEQFSSVPSGLRRWRTRILRVPFNATKPGITPPPHPSHGPWRRLEAQRVEGDIRIPPNMLAVQVHHDPARFAIEPLRNPSRGPIEFALTLPGAGPATAELLDVAGRLWMSRELRASGEARTTVHWDESRNLAPGCYLLRIRQGDRSASARFVILR